MAWAVRMNHTLHNSWGNTDGKESAVDDYNAPFSITGKIRRAERICLGNYTWLLETLRRWSAVAAISSTSEHLPAVTGFTFPTSSEEISSLSYPYEYTGPVTPGALVCT